MTNKVVHNFGKNVSFVPTAYAEPKNEEELLELLKQYRGQPIRVVGSRHAWSDAIKTSGLLISVKHFNHVQVNENNKSVRVGAGCQIKHLLAQLKPHGLTLPSLGLIDEQTVAGATATGTHGSGKHCLSHYIRRVRVAHYDPQSDEPVITDIEAGSALQAARCSLGLLGVIIELEMDTRESYRIEEHLQRHESVASMLAAEKQYPLQQFYLMPWSWHLFGQHRLESNQPRSRAARLYRMYWHLGIDWCLHLVIFLSVKILGIRRLIHSIFRYVMPNVMPRNWRVTDDSHAILTMEHELFRHIEIELFVTRTKLEAALDHVKHTIAVFGGQSSEGDTDETIPDASRGSYCHHYPICVRRILVDDTLISMSSQDADESNDDWYAISLISYEWPARRAGFYEFANFLASSMRLRFNARCHWGKYYPLDRDANEQLYPRLEEFREVVQQFDPQSRFANDWLRSVLVADPSE